MTDKTAAELANAAKHTDAQLEAAVAKARTEALAEGEKKGRGEGVTAERERIRGILTSAEAKDRPQLAASLAFEPDMSVEQGSRLLAKAAKEASNGNAFAGLMNKLPNPKVGVDTGAESGAEKPRIDTAEIYRSRLPNHQARSN